MEKGKKITIDKLGELMNKAFMHLEQQISNIRVEMATKKGMSEEFAKVHYRLDVIEGKMINNHENRISKLEDDIRVLKTSKGK